MRHLLAVDRDGDGFETRYYHDPIEGKLVVQRLQDVETNLKANVNEYNSYGDHKASMYKGSGMHKVASIPKAIAEQWLREEGFNIFTASDAEIRRKLNDSDYRKLRTMPSKL